jgi:hypothetical protein
MSVNVPMCAHVVAVYCSFAVAGDGQLDEIEVLFRRGLKPCIAQLGNDHLVGFVDRALGRVATRSFFHCAKLECFQASETAQARQRWAFVLAQQSKYQEAEPHVRVSLETFRVSRDVGYPAELLDC